MNNKIWYISLISLFAALGGGYWFKHQLAGDNSQHADLLMQIERNISLLMAQDIQLSPKQQPNINSQIQQLKELQLVIEQYQQQVNDVYQWHDEVKHQQFLAASYEFLEQYKRFNDLKNDIDQAFLQYSQLSTQLKNNRHLAPHIVQLSSSLLLYQLRLLPTAKQQAQKVTQFLARSADEPGFRSLSNNLWQMVSYTGFLLENLELQEAQLIKLKNNPMVDLLTQILSYHDKNVQSYQRLETIIVSAFIVTILGLVLVFSLRKNRELAQKSLQAEAATRAKSQFLANMSHEIRTPMNAIIGFTELVLQSSLNKKQVDFVRKIKISAESLLLIINDILDFSKIEAGKLEIDQVTFDLTKQLDILCNMFARRCEQKQIEMIIDDKTELAHQLIGDPLRLNQILINLVSNAIKFTEEGQVVITIENLDKQAFDQLIHNKSQASERESPTENRAYLRFSVSDTGVGIPPEKQNKLFQAFAQADSSTTRQFGGTGLGLSICKRLVELMGGGISVTSELGKGSQFSFCLPLKMELTEVICLRAPELADKHIVLVDDNSLVSDVVEHMLKATKADVITFNSAAAALTYLAKQPLCDLLIIDWCMPEMNGIELVRHLRLIPIYQKLPVVIITAFGNEKVQQQAIQVGAKDFLVKPFTTYGLWQSISQAIGLWRKTQVNQPTAKQVTSLEGIQLLLVEDNKINQLLVKEFLNNSGAVLDVAFNGLQAVNMVEQHSFDIILMDVQMPVMDGYEATRKIREMYSAELLPIVAMTANAMKGDRERCIAAGMNDYISKPIKKDLLFEVLQRQLSVALQTKSSQVNTEDKPMSNSSIDNVYAARLYTEYSNNQSDGLYPLLDIKDAINRLAGDQGMYCNLLKMFIAEYTQMAEMIVEDIHTNELTQAVDKAHALKGVAANLSAIQLQQLASNVERQLREQQLPSEKILAALIDTSKKTIEAIEQYCCKQTAIN
ncbi:response regulator [Spartinivicinus ruber]|uniref:response regulator n=1 Tax=Spartinivicinus ruber TaxID=2683272 RepID=UPI0013D04813|nr:response regulator [Spartinivicinus ruber]